MRELRQIDGALTLFLDESRRNADMLAANPLVLRGDEITTSYVTRTEKKNAAPDPDDALGKELTTFMSTVQKTHPNYVDAYVGTRKGGFIISTATELPGGYDPRARSYNFV